MNDQHFISFQSKHAASLIPDQLNDPFKTDIPEICKIAAQELQDFISTNQEHWNHNFGMNAYDKTPAKGKMFGVLIVKNKANELGYISAFSGKFQADPHPAIFVPSLFDITTDDNFITKGMRELSQISGQIKVVQQSDNSNKQQEVLSLKNKRKDRSTELQQQLFDAYHFLNKSKKLKSLCAIFEDFDGKKPAAGAGECAAPKLLQYAYSNNMKPLAIAEFWWGKPNKAHDRKHRNFYPACRDKCRPILSYMLNE